MSPLIASSHTIVAQISNGYKLDKISCNEAT
jgi:hypothetical protein